MVMSQSTCGSAEIEKFSGAHRQPRPHASLPVGLHPTPPYISPGRPLTSLALIRRRSAAPWLPWETTRDPRVSEAVSRRRELRLGLVERRARSRTTMAEQLYLENIDEFVTDQNKIVRI